MKRNTSKQLLSLLTAFSVLGSSLLPASAVLAEELTNTVVNPVENKKEKTLDTSHIEGEAVLPDLKVEQQVLRDTSKVANYHYNQENETLTIDTGNDSVSVIEINQKIKSEATYKSAKKLVLNGSITNAVSSTLNLEEVTSVEGNLITIPKQIFYGWEKLNSVTFDAATEIQDYAFFRTISLETISLKTVQKIGKGAFSSNNKLKNIELPAVITLGENSFSNNGNLQEVKAPNLTKIEQKVFENTTQLKVIDLSKVSEIEGDFLGQADDKVVIFNPTEKTLFEEKLNKSTKSLGIAVAPEKTFNDSNDLNKTVKLPDFFFINKDTSELTTDISWKKNGELTNKKDSDYEINGINTKDNGAYQASLQVQNKQGEMIQELVSGTQTVYYKNAGITGVSDAVQWEYDSANKTVTFTSGGQLGDNATLPWAKDIKKTDIQKIIFNENVVAPENMSSYFSGLTNLTEISGLDKVDTSKVTHMQLIFDSNYNLTNLDVSKWNTESVESMYGMFFDTRKLEKLDVSNWITKNVKDTMYMFFGNYSLVELDLSKWDTKNLTSMHLMFRDTTKLKKLGLSGTFKPDVLKDSALPAIDATGEYSGRWILKTEEGVAAKYANSSDFITKYDNKKPGIYVWELKGEIITGKTGTVDWEYNSTTQTFIFTSGGKLGMTPPWDNKYIVDPDKIKKIVFKENVIAADSMSYYFSKYVHLVDLEFDYGLINLTEIKGLEKINTSNVHSMTAMFYGSRNLEKIDLSNWDTSNVTIMYEMFKNTNKLKKIGLSRTFKPGLLKDSALPGIDSTGDYSGRWILKTEEGVAAKYANSSNFITQYDNKKPGLYEWELKSERISGQSGTVAWEYDEASKTVNFESTGDLGDSTTLPWNTHEKLSKDKIQKIIFQKNVVAPENMSSYFSGLTNLTEISGLDKVDTSKVTTMHKMFKENVKLTTINVSNWNIGNVTDMQEMFASNSALTNLDVSKWNTSKVTNMIGIFYATKKLEILDVSNWDTSNVTSMAHIFQLMENLKTLDVSKWKTGKVTSMQEMFASNSALTNLDLSKWDTQNVTSMYLMFRDTTKLTKLGLSETFNPDILKESALPAIDSTGEYSGRWILKTPEGVAARYANSSDFITKYDKKKPGLYKWELKSEKLISGQSGTVAWEYDEENQTVIFKSQGNLGSSKTLPWKDGSIIKAEIKKISFEKSVVAPDDMKHYFSELTNLTGINGLANLDTSNVTDMYGMFESNCSLTELDLSKWDTSKALTGTMWAMFRDTKKLTKLGLSGTFKPDILRHSSLPAIDATGEYSGRWILKTEEGVAAKYANSSDFITKYDNTKPGLYEWELKSERISGQSGTVAWEYDEASKTVNFESTGDLGDSTTLPWNTHKKLSKDKIQKIIFQKNVVAPETMSSYFSGLTNLTEISGLDKVDTSKVTTMHKMFQENVKLTTINVSNWNIGNVTDMQEMFASNYALTNLDVSKWNTSNVTNMLGIFYGTKKLEILDVSSWDTSNVTSMAHMFQLMGNLKTLDVSNWKTGKVTSMQEMFASNSALTNLDVSKWNTSKVTNMYGTFYCNQNLETLDVSNWDTSNVTSMSRMFLLMGSMKTLDVSNWKTGKVTSMQEMFSGVTSLTKLDLSKWDTQNVKNMHLMFLNTKKLTKLGLSGTFNPDVLKGSGLPAIDATGEYSGRWILKTEEGVAAKYANSSDFITKYDKKKPGLYEWELKSEQIIGISGTVAWEYDEASKTVNFESTGDLGDSTTLPWNTHKKLSKDKIQKIIFQKNVVAPETMSSYFSGLKNLTEIRGLDKVNTRNVTNMSKMFQGNSTLQTLDVSNWETANVMTMQEMFAGNSALMNLDVSKWDTSNVTNMSKMFQGNSTLQTLDVSNWETANVMTMQEMFAGNSALMNLDVSKWDTSNVTTMSKMFQGNSTLQTLDVSYWNIGNVTDMQELFASNSALTNLDVSNWNTSKVTNMLGIFYATNKLETLDVSRWDTSKVTSMANMFHLMGSLKTIDVSKWDTSNVTTMQEMFSGVTSLTNLDVSKWKTSKVTNMYGTFYATKNLEILNVSNWATENVTTMQEMFTGTSSLKELDLSKWNTSKVTNMVSMFRDTKNLTKLGLSGTFKTNNLKYSGLPSINTTGDYSGGWILKTPQNLTIQNLSIRYSSTQDLLEKYNSQNPGIYVWELKKNTITVKDSTIIQGTTWDPSSNFVSATNKAGNDIKFSEMTVKGTVDTNIVGQYTVKYVYDGNEETANVTVEKKVIPIESITVTNAPVTMSVGQTHQLKVTLDPWDTTETNLIYSSSSPDVATVSKTGLIRVLKKGFSYIEIKSESNPEIKKQILIWAE